MHTFFSCCRKQNVSNPLLHEELLAPVTASYAPEPTQPHVVGPIVPEINIHNPLLHEELLAPVTASYAPEPTLAEIFEPKVAEIDEAVTPPRPGISTIEADETFITPTPPNSHNAGPQTYAATEEKLNKMVDFFLKNPLSPITVFHFLQINNHIIDPLREGNYDLASANFCTLYQQKPSLFYNICKKTGIPTKNIYPELTNRFNLNQ